MTEDAALARARRARDARSRARRRTCRGAFASVIRCCDARSTTRRRPAGDCAPTSARRHALAARGAAATARAHHVEQSARIGDLDAVALLTEAGAATAQRAPGVRGALVVGGVAAAARRGRRARAAHRPARRARRLARGDRAPRRRSRRHPRAARAAARRRHGACALRSSAPARRSSTCSVAIERRTIACDRRSHGVADHGSVAAAELMTRAGGQPLLRRRLRRRCETAARRRSRGRAPWATGRSSRPRRRSLSAACAFAGEIAAGAGVRRRGRAARRRPGGRGARDAHRTRSRYLAWAETIIERFDDCIAPRRSRRRGRARYAARAVPASALAGAGAGAGARADASSKPSTSRSAPSRRRRLTANAHVARLGAHAPSRLALLTRDPAAALRAARESVELTRGQERSVIFTMAERIYSVALGETGEHARCVELLRARRRRAGPRPAAGDAGGRSTSTR